MPVSIKPISEHVAVKVSSRQLEDTLGIIELTVFVLARQALQSLAMRKVRFARLVATLGAVFPRARVAKKNICSLGCVEKKPRLRACNVGKLHRLRGINRLSRMPARPRLLCGTYHGILCYLYTFFRKMTEFCITFSITSKQYVIFTYCNE